MSDWDDGSGNLFSIFGEIRASLGDMVEGQRRVNKRLASQATIPVDYVKGGSAVVAQGQTIVEVGCGGPDMGHIWLLRRLAVGTMPVSTAQSGVSAYVFVTAEPQGFVINNMPVLGWQTFTNTVPNTAHFSNRQLIVRAGEHIRVVFTGVTAAVQYQAECTVEDYEQAAFGEQFAL